MASPPTPPSRAPTPRRSRRDSSPTAAAARTRHAASRAWRCACATVVSTCARSRAADGPPRRGRRRRRRLARSLCRVRRVRPRARHRGGRPAAARSRGGRRRRRRGGGGARRRDDGETEAAAAPPSSRARSALRRRFASTARLTLRRRPRRPRRVRARHPFASTTRSTRWRCARPRRERSAPRAPPRPTARGAVERSCHALRCGLARRCVGFADAATVRFRLRRRDATRTGVLSKDPFLAARALVRAPPRLRRRTRNRRARKPLRAAAGRSAGRVRRVRVVLRRLVSV